jgi:hypothetical protein
MAPVYRTLAEHSDELFIYAIVLLNTLVQVLLIWRLKFPLGGKWKYILSALAIPVLIMGTMRLAVASGVIHERVADQSIVERIITMATSLLLIAGPWLATLAAILDKKRRADLAALDAAIEMRSAAAGQPK